MNLSQRMIRTFSLNISTACGQSWTALSDSAEDTVRITPRKVIEPGEPNGLVLSAVSTTWLPYSHYQVFDFLRDERRRAQVHFLNHPFSPMFFCPRFHHINIYIYVCVYTVGCAFQW